MDIKELMKKDVFAVEAGVVLEDATPGHAVATLKIEKRHLNAYGVAQGGAIFTLADLALAAAVNAYGVLAFSMQSDIRYLESAFEGDVLTATAHETLLRKRIAQYHISVKRQDGTEVALFDAICYRKQG